MVVDTTCSTQKPICWRDSWPDDAIYQAKVHNAKLFNLCPAIKARIKVTCADIDAETNLALSNMSVPANGKTVAPTKAGVPP